MSRMLFGLLLIFAGMGVWLTFNHLTSPSQNLAQVTEQITEICRQATDPKRVLDECIDFELGAWQTTQSIMQGMRLIGLGSLLVLIVLLLRQKLRSR